MAKINFEKLFAEIEQVGGQPLLVPAQKAVLTKSAKLFRHQRTVLVYIPSFINIYSNQKTLFFGQFEKTTYFATKPNTIEELYPDAVIYPRKYSAVNTNTGKYARISVPAPIIQAYPTATHIVFNETEHQNLYEVVLCQTQ